MKATRVLNKHQQRTEATKGKLFKAAQRVFAKHGFAAASIDEIAKRAGFTRGAFYAHFKTKEDLFFALLEERAARDLRDLRQRMENQPEAQRMSLLCDYSVERLRDLQWSLLQLEFKLYIARSGARGMKLSERFQTLRLNIQRQYSEDLLPKSLDWSKAHTGNKVLFEAILDGLSLQRWYKGNVTTEEDAERELRRAFALLQKSC